MAKKEKQVKKYDLTPEQEAKIKKLSIIGIIFLSIILLALVGTILGVWLSNREKKVKPVEDPLKGSLVEVAEVLEIDALLKPDVEGIPNNLKTKYSDVFAVSNLSSVYIVIHNEKIDSSLKKDLDNFYNKQKDTTSPVIRVFDEDLKLKENLKDFLKRNDKECKVLFDALEGMTDENDKKAQAELLDKKLNEKLDNNNLFVLRFYLSNLSFENEDHKLFNEANAKELLKGGTN